MPWATRSGRRIYYFEAGEGRTVLLLHGMTNAGLAWSSQVPSLVDAGFRVVVPDMVGHGASDPAAAPVTVDELVADLSAILDATSVASADLVGVSMGGTTAIAAAIGIPDRVDRLVVLNAGPSTDDKEFKALSAKWASTLRSEDGALRLQEELWPFSVNDAFSRSYEGRRTYQLWQALAASSDGPAMADVITGVVGYDASDRLATIEAETLLMAGSEDPSAAFLGGIAQVIPGAAFTMIEGGKHIANVDEAAAVTARLLDFLARSPSDASAS